MADAEAAVDSWYALKEDYGDSHGRLPKDALFHVTHIFPAGEPGVGVIDDEVVILRHLERSSVTNRLVQRRISVRKSDFGKLYVEATEPKKDTKEWNAAQKNKGGGA